MILLKKLRLLSLIFSCLFFSFAYLSHAQKPYKSSFWENVRYGGGLGLGISNNVFNVSVAPNAIYQVNESFATGAGLNFNHTDSRDITLLAYGGSLMNFYNPIPEIQLSAELEQWRVNQRQDNLSNINYWTTALFLGVGYRTRNITVGLRYDIIDDDRSIYADPLVPFIRVYF